MYEYEHAGAVQRLVRQTAATRPMAWIYARIQPPLDRFVYGLTRGSSTLSSALSGLPVVMLRTTGARTGEQRSQPVLGLPDGETLVVIASNYGRPSHPGWYHNLRAHPRATVTVHGATREMEAQELEGPERDRCFTWAAAQYPGFEHYRRWAAPRRIAVFRLVRARIDHAPT